MRSLWILAGVTVGALTPAPLNALLPWLAGLSILAALWMRQLGWALLSIGAAALAHALVIGTVDTQVRCEERVLAQVQVADVVARGTTGWRFEGLIRHPRQPGRGDVRAMVEMPDFGPQRPAAGETWQLLLSYQPIPADIGIGADPLRLAVRDRRQASARALDSPLNHRLQVAQGSLISLRERVARRIERRALDPAAGALLAALAVGATGEVTNRQWRDFSATGITHLVAISGAHVTFFALLSMAAVRRLWNGQSWLQRWVRRERLAGIVGVVLATAYALLSGFSVPAQRTMLMLAAYVLWRETARATAPCWSLMVALCAVLVLDPLAILGAGFWLSFAAVAAILLVPGSRLGRDGAMRDGARVQFAVSLALLPFTVLLFGSFSFVGLLVNVVAIPLFEFVLVPGALLATLAYLLPGAWADTVGDWLVDCTGAVIEWTLPLLSRTAQWSASSWLGNMTLPQLLLAALAGLCCLLPLRRSIRLAALALAFTGFVGMTRLPAPGSAQLVVLSAGSQTSVIVTTAQHRLIFGTGEVHGGDGRRFRTRVMDRLQREGGPAPELLVIGRPWFERLAASTLAAARWPDLALIGERAGRPLPPEIQTCQARQWDWDGVVFRLRVPSAGRGCALEVRAAGGTALLTLDIDETGWRSLLAEGLDAHFLVLPPAATQFGAGKGERWLLAVRQHSDAGRRRWEQLDEAAQRGGHHLLDASALSALPVSLGGQRPVALESSRRWRWGAWSGRLPSVNCSTL